MAKMKLDYDTHIEQIRSLKHEMGVLENLAIDTDSSCQELTN